MKLNVWAKYKSISSDLKDYLDSVNQSINKKIVFHYPYFVIFKKKKFHLSAEADTGAKSQKDFCVLFDTFG